MQTEKFDLNLWRKSLFNKTSKLKAAKLIGVGKNAYNRYEDAGECPRVVMLAAQRVKDAEIESGAYEWHIIRNEEGEYRVEEFKR